MKRHISSDNIASSSCVDNSSVQPCYSYQEGTLNDTIYATKNTRNCCCKSSNEFTRHDECKIMNMHKKEHVDSCSCSHSRSHCQYPSVSGFAGSLNNDYATSGCDHHRYIHPASDINSCVNSIPVILCRPEQIYGSKFEDDLKHISLQHSNMYAVPIIPQSRCSCFPQSSIHRGEKEGHRVTDRYAEVKY